jgi:hypothetical protein
MELHNKKEHCMRKTFIILSAISAIAFAASASAQERDRVHPAATATGVAAGTVFGLGLAEGWWGSSAAISALPSSAAGAAAVGGVAGIGTVAVIDAATQPCRGFRAMFSPFVPGPSGCANGEYVGYRVSQRETRRVYR